MSCAAPTFAIEMQDQSAFIDRAEEWNRLLQAGFDNRIFYRADWLRTWWERFGPGQAHVLTVAGEDGSLRAALPLQTQETDGLQVLTLVGDYNVSDYMDALAIKGEASELLTALWCTALRDLCWDRLALRHVPSNSPSIPALEAAAASLGLTARIEEDEVCPVALLCSNWEGYLQMLTKKQRHEIRRKLRRAQEGIEWGWRTVRTPEDLRRDLPVFFRLHEASAREKARFMTPPMREYFRAVAEEMLTAGLLRLSIFSREGEDLAATLSFLYRDRYLLYNSGYEPSQAAHSPGIAAVAHAMQDAIEERAVAFDFLSGDEPYKYQFGASNTHTVRVDIERR